MSSNGGSRFTSLRLFVLLAPLSLLACGTLIGLGELEKTECLGDCGGLSAGGTPGSAGSAGAAAFAGAGAGGAMISDSGGMAGGGSAGVTNGGSAGSSSGGTGGSVAAPVCPGGPEPPLAWTEHWYDHNQALTRVYYDDCIALYFDADVAPDAQAWLVPFLSEAWTYSLATYGKMGSERIYVIAHQGRHLGGHSATYIEASHDDRAVIDMGATLWVEGDYDLPAHLLAFLVDSEGAHTKFGAPKADHYGNEGFPLIYKYDLYQALGLTEAAETALVNFDLIYNDHPYPDTFWFRDWFYPVWRDHGQAGVFEKYFKLLQKYYPAGADLWMPSMNYGQYFHFMSGAAGVDLVPLAREAFVWHPTFDDELAAAKDQFPNIRY